MRQLWFNQHQAWSCIWDPRRFSLYEWTPEVLPFEASSLGHVVVMEVSRGEGSARTCLCWRWAFGQADLMTSATDWMWSVTLVGVLNFWITFNASLSPSRPTYCIILPPFDWLGLYLPPKSTFKENLGSECIHWWERMFWVPCRFAPEAGEDIPCVAERQ